MTTDAATLAAFLAALAAKTPTPGGGASACVTGAVAAAQAEMVVAYSVGRKSLAAHEPTLQAALQTLQRTREAFLRLADADAAAYEGLNAAMRAPADQPGRAAAIAGAARAAIEPPAHAVEAALGLLTLLHDLAGITNRQLRSDLAIAAVLAEAAARSAKWNVWINAPSMDGDGGDAGASALAAAEERVHECDRLRKLVESACAKP